MRMHSKPLVLQEKSPEIDLNQDEGVTAEGKITGNVRRNVRKEPRTW